MIDELLLVGSYFSCTVKTERINLFIDKEVSTCFCFIAKPLSITPIPLVAKNVQIYPLILLYINNQTYKS